MILDDSVAFTEISEPLYRHSPSMRSNLAILHRNISAGQRRDRLPTSFASHPQRLSIVKPGGDQCPYSSFHARGLSVWMIPAALRSAIPNSASLAAQIS